MSKGFIFNHEKCVGCGSCGAACILENGWTVRPRSIITLNGEASMPQAVINLSLSCNHCGDPVCLKGCPSKAYYKDEATGAVIINDQKCLGCRYCQWNCPFDAPKFDQGKRVIGKCNLCYSSLEEGRAPACASSCPTGALSYGDIIKQEEDQPEWFPGHRLNPSIWLTGDSNPAPLRIIPATAFSKRSEEIVENRTKPEWSLLVFSFLVTIAVSVISASLIKGVFPSTFLVFAFLIISGIASLFHLGKPFRAWRAVMNIRISPLSREIGLFIISSLLTAAALLSGSSVLLVATAVSGLLTLIAIDNVYTATDRNRSITLHSGQTFLTGLLIISFLAGGLLPFTFVALIKLFLSFFYRKFTQNFIILRFIRTALLLIVMSGFISGFAKPDLLMTLMLLSGELIDRYLFYADFEPENIKRIMNKDINISIK